MSPDVPATGMELVEELQQLRDEVRTLRDAIDEHRALLADMFAEREVYPPPPTHRPIKTLSRDPAAPRFEVGYRLPESFCDEGQSGRDELEMEGEPETEGETSGTAAVPACIADEAPDHREAPGHDDAPEPHEPAKGLPQVGLIRPDRQTRFPNRSPDRWPAPKLDPNALTVDRCDDPDQRNWHRFRVCRGDRVQVQPTKGSSFVGSASEMLPNRKLVYVRDTAGQHNGWYPIAELYPVPARKEHSAPVAQPVRPTCGVENTSSDGDGDTVSGTDTVDEARYTLDDVDAFWEQLEYDELTADDVRAECQRMLAAKRSFLEHMELTCGDERLQRLAHNAGCQNTDQQTKSAIAQALYHRLLRNLALDQSENDARFAGRPVEEVVPEILAGLTDGQLHAFVERMSEGAELE